MALALGLFGKHAFSDAAEGGALDAEVGGDVIEGDRIEDIRMLFDQLEVSFFRGLE